MINVLSSENGGLKGQFDSISVSTPCGIEGSAVPVYQQFSLSVSFQLQGSPCGLPREALIGISVGAAVAGVLVAILVVVIIKALIAKYTRDASAVIKARQAEDLAEPLLKRRM